MGVGVDSAVHRVATARVSERFGFVLGPEVVHRGVEPCRECSRLHGARGDDPQRLGGRIHDEQRLELGRNRLGESREHLISGECQASGLGETGGGLFQRHRDGQPELVDLGGVAAEGVAPVGVTHLIPVVLRAEIRIRRVGRAGPGPARVIRADADVQRLAHRHVHPAGLNGRWNRQAGRLGDSEGHVGVVHPVLHQVARGVSGGVVETMSLAGGVDPGPGAGGRLAEERHEDLVIPVGPGGAVEQ